ncbi:hypothetical protein EES46_12985 [Streptomyces sp. ADI98-10]|nr:hypothetical protein EES46_12985 [Streptomyces sp. ADI98-10]
MDLARDPGGEPAHGDAAWLFVGGGRDPDRDAHAQQVEVGAEDVLGVGAARHARGQRRADLGEEPQGERVPVVAGGQGGGRDAVRLLGPLGLLGGEVAQAQGGRQPAGRAVRAVQGARRVEGARGLPVLGAAGDDEPDAVLAQPDGGAGRPVGEPVGQQRRHLLGTVEHHQQRVSGVGGEPGDPLRGGRAHVASGCSRRGDDPGGAGERTARGVRDGGVVGQQVRAAQPEGGGGRAAVGAAGGEGGQLGGAAGAGCSDESEDQARTGGEGGELGVDVLALDRGGAGLRAVRRADGGGGELEGPGEVEVGAVGGGGGGVAPQQRVQRVVHASDDRQGEAGRLVRGGEGGAEDADDRAGGRVGDGSADGRAPGAQGIAPVGAQGQLQGGGDRVTDAVGCGAGGGGGAKDPGLAPAVGGDVHVAAGLRAVASGDGQGFRVEGVGAAGAQEGEAEGGQRGDVVGGDGAGAAVAAVEEERARGGDGLVGGDDRAAVVRDESRPSRPAGLITDSYQLRPVPTAHGPTLGRRWSPGARGRGKRPPRPRCSLRAPVRWGE